MVCVSHLRSVRKCVFTGIVILMSQVVAKFKIFPEGAETDLNELKKEIERSLPADASVHKYEEEPVAFGLNLLIAYILMPEEESGKIDEVEGSIRGLSGVSEVEVAMVRRI